MVRLRPFFAAIAVFLIFAPFWLPKAQLAIGQSLFLTPDSLLLAGMTLVIGFISTAFPHRMVAQMERVSLFIRKRFLLAAVFFCAALLGALVFINRHVLLSFFHSADEHSCYFLAECIRAGKWYAEPPPIADFFDAVHVGIRDEKWFSVYPPGWPILFAAALMLNLKNWMNPLLTLVSIFFLYQTGKKLFGFTVAWTSVAIMSLTAFFLFNNASYFSHTTCLLTVSVFLYSFLRWRERREITWAVIAGLAIGYGLLTRYLTMASMAAPFLGYEAYLIFSKRERFTKSHLLFAVVLAAGLSANFFYNHIITGNFFEAPNHYHHQWERLGFHDDYGWREVIRFVTSRLFFLSDWSPPLYLVLYFASLPMILRKSTAMQNLFMLGFFYPLIGYIFYYSWGGNQFGPRYYFEGFPMLCLGAAYAVHTYWERQDLPVKKFLTGIIIASLAVSIYQISKHAHFYRAVSRERKSLYHLAEDLITKPAVVFVRGFIGDKLILTEEDAIRNRPDLKDRILYARDLKERNAELMKWYPDRQFFIGSYDRKAKRPHLEPLPQGNVS